MNLPDSAMAARLLRQRLPRVCIAITGSDPGEMIDRAQAVMRDNPFVEFRLDYLPNPALFFPKLKGFIEYNPHAALIATCRRTVSGGKFKGTIAAQVDILGKAAALGCQMVDVEIESASHLKTKDWEKLKQNATVILSSHDFKRTSKLNDVYEHMAKYPGDFFKIVTTANSLYDNVVMMKFLEQKSDERYLIGVCMGEQGIISRILGVRAGSAFTFAAANPGEETAPGQIAARTLHETYRIDRVDAATRVYGVVGDPVSHSLSPAMMNAAFRRETLNAVYLGLHAKSLEDLLACVRDIPIHGLSVTMPYKEAILKHLDKTDPISQKVGACNTVIRSQEGKLYGFNTDVAGVVRPLEQRFALATAKVLVLGAGGAARAAVFGLKERGVDVYIMNRTPVAAQKLAKQAKAKVVDRAKLAKLTFDCIINATSVGMDGEEEKPLLSEKELNTKYVMDMVYHTETRFVAMARQKGVHVIGGVEMFVQQGARQFEIWTGKPAPVDEMERVVQHAVQQRAQMEAAAKAAAPAKRAKK